MSASRRRGLSLVEVTISMLVISVMLTAALRTLAATTTTESRSVERLQGRDLAEQLLAEIRDRAYDDPDTIPEFGPESGETTTDRRHFDDVDDYHGWKSSPPTDATGTPVLDDARWSRTAVVGWVRLDDPTAAAGSDTGLKRILVTVFRGDRRITQVEAFAGSAGRDRRVAVAGAVEGLEPRAAFVATTRSGPAPLSVSVDATASVDPRGGGLAWRWTFGDGSVATTEVATYKYTVPGTYTLSLAVTDNIGRVSVRSLIIVVESP